MRFSFDARIWMTLAQSLFIALKSSKLSYTAECWAADGLDDGELPDLPQHEPLAVMR